MKHRNSVEWSKFFAAYFNKIDRVLSKLNVVSNERGSDRCQWRGVARPAGKDKISYDNSHYNGYYYRKHYEYALATDSSVII
mmetsp:Transcript_10455/g.15924  ORF Transcript_10455/g.15924 Transcript_10455/m.15924 type:complete len:82 (-) Transcript_10455:21-266(-)